MSQEENVSNEASSDFGIGDFFGAISNNTPVAAEQGTTQAEQETTHSVQVDVPPVVEEEVAPKIDGTGAEEKVEKGKEESVVSYTPEQDMEEMRKQLNDAMGQLSTLMAQVNSGQQVKGPELKIPENPKELSQLDFLDGQAPTDFLESPEALNGLLNKVATIAARAGQQAGYEMAMRTVPSVVQSAAQQQFQLQHVADNFYKQNADLIPFKKAVGMAAVDFYSKNPKATHEQILEGAAVATRNILRMRGTTTGRVPAQPAATSGVAGGTSRTASSSQLTSLEQQILDTINAAQ